MASVNLRPSWEWGAYVTTLSRFSCITKKKKTRCVAPRRFASLVAHKFWTKCDFVYPRSLQNRGQVNWPCLKKFATVSSLQFLLQRFQTWRITWRHGCLLLVYLGFFLYLWPKVRSAAWPLHYKSREKNETASRSVCTHMNSPTLLKSWWFRTAAMPKVRF